MLSGVGGMLRCQVREPRLHFGARPKFTHQGTSGKTRPRHLDLDHPQRGARSTCDLGRIVGVRAADEQVPALRPAEHHRVALGIEFDPLDDLAAFAYPQHTVAFRVGEQSVGLDVLPSGSTQAITQVSTGVFAGSKRL